MKCADSGRVMNVDVTCHELPGGSGGWSRDPVHPSSRRERTPSCVISIVFAASFVLSGFAASPAQAQQTITGTVDVPPDINQPAGLIIGAVGAPGTLNINGINTPGGLVTTTTLSIGGLDNSPPGGATGTVNVTGPSARLVTTGVTIVGASAAGGPSSNIGALNITGGGQATVNQLVISSASGGVFPGINVGTVLVSGPGSTLTVDPVGGAAVGQSGTGTLTI